MKKDNTEKKIYSIKQLTKIMGYVLFGTVFLFSFLFIEKTIRNHYIILLSVFGSALIVEIIVWIILYFVFKKKSKIENDKNIEKVIAKLEQEEIDEMKSNLTKTSDSIDNNRKDI